MMMKAAKLGLAAAAAVGALELCGSPLNAQAAASADRCAAPENQSEMNFCAEADFQKADRELTAVYAKFKPVPPMLRVAERAWIAYRDAECDFQGDAEAGGSMQPMIISGCMATLTEERIKTLQNDLVGQ